MLTQGRGRQRASAPVVEVQKTCEGNLTCRIIHYLQIDTREDQGAKTTRARLFESSDLQLDYAIRKRFQDRCTMVVDDVKPEFSRVGEADSRDCRFQRRICCG
jgi:hypothetical protein